MPIVPPGIPELHFDYSGSDIIILRSCDARDFRVPKPCIVNNSPVLRELIGSVSNTSDSLNGEELEPLPVVKLPESGATLYSLLTFIFPVTPCPIVPSTTEEIMNLLAVARKYEMDLVFSHILGTIARYDPPFIRPETALNIYFLAQKHKLHLEVLLAAKVTLRLSMTIEDLIDKLDFPGMTGAYLHQLWKYHQRVRTDLKSVLLEFRNSGFPDNVDALRCTTQSHPSWRWLDDYIESIAEAPHLFDLIEFETARARHIHHSECSCAIISSQVIRSFWEALTAVVHGTIREATSTDVLVLVEEEITPENSYPPSVPLCLDIPDANIIVRSSDQVNFRVHKSVLAMSSPFFKDLLSLPQPPGEELIDGLPVVQLSEDAGLLNSLISLLYPISTVIPDSYEKVFALLAACQKYDMDLIQCDIRDATRSRKFPTPFGVQNFRAYAIANSMGLVPEMQNAAQSTLTHSMTFESLGEGLRSFHGQALCDLRRYRAANNVGFKAKAQSQGWRPRWGSSAGGPN